MIAPGGGAPFSLYVRTLVYYKPICSELDFFSETEVLNRDLVTENFEALPLKVLFDQRQIRRTEEDFQSCLLNFLLRRSTISPHGLNSFGIEDWLFVGSLLVLEPHVTFLRQEDTWVVYLV
jgi:hypothetical protein